MAKRKPISIYSSKPLRVWEWALVYPAFWLIVYVIGPLVARLPERRRTYAKDVYRGGI